MITQKLFNTIYLGLHAQGWNQAWDVKRQTCVYRDDVGNRCAIGQTIPDDRYTPEMDKNSAYKASYSVRDFQKMGLLLDLTSDEFSYLQGAHDTNPVPDDMEKAFRELAGKYGLTVPEIQQELSL